MPYRQNGADDRGIDPNLPSSAMHQRCHLYANRYRTVTPKRERRRAEVASA
jgi:hypothetical protein